MGTKTRKGLGGGENRAEETEEEKTREGIDDPTGEDLLLLFGCCQNGMKEPPTHTTNT